MDEPVLHDRFARLAAAFADGAEVPPVAGLADRSRRRRRRKARVAGGLVAAIVLLAGAAAVAWPRGGPDGGSIQVTVEPTPVSTDPSATTTPTPVGPEVFTIGTVPDGLAVGSCGSVPSPRSPEGLLGYCRYSDPRSLIDSLTINWEFAPAPADVQRAFEEEDVASALEVTGQVDRPGARFTELGGRRVLALGVVDVLDGSVVDQPDQVTSSYAFLAEGTLVTVSPSGVTPAQLEAAVAGLGFQPVWAFVVDGDALPEGAEPLVQGPRPRWTQRRGLDVSGVRVLAGATYGLDYRLPGERRPVSIELTTGIDVVERLDAVVEELGAALPPEAHQTIGGRPALVLERGVNARTALASAGYGPRVLVELAPDQLLQVFGAGADLQAVRAVANAMVR